MHLQLGRDNPCLPNETLSVANVVKRVTDEIEKKILDGKNRTNALFQEIAENIKRMQLAEADLAKQV